MPKMVIADTERLTSPSFVPYVQNVAIATYHTTHVHDRKGKSGPIPTTGQPPTSNNKDDGTPPTGGPASTAPSVQASTTDAIPHHDPLGTGEGPPRTAGQGQAVVQKGFAPLNIGGDDEARSPQLNQKTKAALHPPPKQQESAKGRKRPRQSNPLSVPHAHTNESTGITPQPSFI